MILQSSPENSELRLLLTKSCRYWSRHNFSITRDSAQELEEAEEVEDEDVLSNLRAAGSLLTRGGTFAAASLARCFHAFTRCAGGGTSGCLGLGFGKTRLVLIRRAGCAVPCKRTLGGASGERARTFPLGNAFLSFILRPRICSLLLSNASSTWVSNCSDLESSGSLRRFAAYLGFEHNNIAAAVGALGLGLHIV